MPIETHLGTIAALSMAAAQQRPDAWPRLERPGTITMLIILIGVIFVACGGASGSARQDLPAIASGSSPVMRGDEAPNFTFTLFQGHDKLGADPLTPGSLRGKPLIINFWAGLCPPCRAELPDLQKFDNEFKDQVTLVGIDLGEFTGLGTLQDAKNLLGELNITFPIASTDDNSVIRKYKVLGIPTTIFIDARGYIFRNWGGALNLEVLRDQSLQMLGQ